MPRYRISPLGTQLWLNMAREGKTPRPKFFMGTEAVCMASTGKEGPSTPEKAGEAMGRVLKRRARREWRRPRSRPSSSRGEGQGGR